MSVGWLSPWAIRDSALGKWIWKAEDPLIPAWEFPPVSGKILYNFNSSNPAIVHVEHFNKILALDLTHTVNAEDLGAALPITCTLANQPDVPRTLQFTFSHGANISAFSVTIVGVDAKGVTQTKTYTQADGWTFWTDIAFATINSIIITSRTGTGVGETLSVGLWGHIGLANKISATADVFKIVKSVAAGNAEDFETTAWLAHLTYDTIDLEVTGNIVDGDSYTVYYKTSLANIS